MSYTHTIEMIPSPRFPLLFADHDMILNEPSKMRMPAIYKTYPQSDNWGIEIGFQN